MTPFLVQAQLPLLVLILKEISSARKSRQNIVKSLNKELGQCQINYYEIKMTEDIEINNLFDPPNPKVKPENQRERIRQKLERMRKELEGKDWFKEGKILEIKGEKAEENKSDK